MVPSSSTPSAPASDDSKPILTGPFAYQTRLLERTTSRGSVGSLSRAGSTSNRSPFTAPTASAIPASTRARWSQTHRISGSLDTLRGKWEEKSRPEPVLEDRASSSSLSRESSLRSEALSLDSESPSEKNSLSSIPQYQPPKLTDTKNDGAELQRTPAFLKRRTLPPPIVASPLSPNTTGVAVESNSPSDYQTNFAQQRIHLPTYGSYQSPKISSPKQFSSGFPQAGPSVAHSTPPARFRRSNSVGIVSLNQTGVSSHDTGSSSSSQTSIPQPPRMQSTSSAPSSQTRRPMSIYGSPLVPDSENMLPSLPHEMQKTNTTDAIPPSSVSGIPQPAMSRRPVSMYGNSTSSVLDRYRPPGIDTIKAETKAPDKPASRSFQPPTPSPPASVMSPTPYRSSYMSKKASTYGESFTTGRRLGRHLPRIASGDGIEDPVDDSRLQRKPPEIKVEDRRKIREKLETRTVELTREPLSPNKLMSRDLTAQPAGSGDVAGIPGRQRFSRDKTPKNSSMPLPSSRLTRGLWADVQRHLLQAYEYLCRVGEAQQWIEGCLGERLEFGVVEMEEGLRNGVVLAKLVRALYGDKMVVKIYEAPKLDFRHSDNINIFFNFVRKVGLPESFIFELTDLYEKKNFPKVIYCIHALSHLLARRGLAERIGNLVGQLQFSDNQLQATQKGLKEAGVPMPNFGNVGKELAKGMNEEAEVEVETEDERRDRMLLENEESIRKFQDVCFGFLVRKAQTTQRGRLRLAERHIPKFQALCRGVLARRRLSEEDNRRADLTPWVISLQARARMLTTRRLWLLRLRRIRAVSPIAIKLQAQIRGAIQRRRFALLKQAIKRSTISIVKLQTQARGRLARNNHSQVVKSFSRPAIAHSVVGFQAHARGMIARSNVKQKLSALKRFEGIFTALQSQSRGLLMRRRMRSQLAKLDDVSDILVRIQAAVRTYLARKRLLLLIRGLRKATPMVVGLQARARANLARQQHANVAKALTEVKVVTAVNSFQALARAAITRNRHREQTKCLEFCEPDVIGVQAVIRGALVRQEYFAWRDHLRQSHPVATILQAMLRGVMLRNNFREKMRYYRENLEKVVKIQSLFRAKETREQYRQLTLGKNVNVGTIKNFVHLLDDSEGDFQEEIKVERLRKRVVEGIRENQELESSVSDLDARIGMVVQNAKSHEDIIKARRILGADNAAAHAARASVLAAHGDPFAGPNTLDRTSKRKLELYQQLFYLLQTRSEYLSRLFLRMSADNTPEKDRRLVERVVLTLFGYGQDRREDYLLLKLFQASIRDEIASANSVDDIINGHPMYVNVAVHYIRPKQVPYVRETLQAVIRDIVASDDLDLEVDPSAIHRARIDIEEMRSGMASNKPKDLPYYEALDIRENQTEYIRHLQQLQWWTGNLISAVTQSTKRMPYSMRFLARETLVSVREMFPDVSDEVCAACIGKLVYYRYINPAIITPETFDIVSTTVDIAARKNLAQISRVMTQITSGREFPEDALSYVPINESVCRGIEQMTSWMLQVADISDAEAQFHAHEFLDATVQPKPIYISPNEVYSMHTLLVQHQEFVAPARDDTLRIILAELDGVPMFGSDELKDARDRAITLDLTNRFANVRDPRAIEKALWVQAKRGVLAILRVQPAQDLVDALMRPVTEDDELAWETVLENEMENEQVRQIPRRQPSAAAQESAYRLEDIRSLTFKEVKAHAIFYLLELEKSGKISRADGFQGILNAIASDVRSKHRKRLQRQQEMESMNEALKGLADRKRYFEEQIKSYHDYVDTAMSTMQRGKGKKRFVLPFTKQFFHLRDLQRNGVSPQFGSYKYSAKYLYEKGILLSVDQYSPRQFDKVDITLSSNVAGVFTLLLEATTLGLLAPVAKENIRMEDLLQAQFENRSSIPLFKGLVKVNLNLFLYQINKKFYL